MNLLSVKLLPLKRQKFSGELEPVGGPAALLAEMGRLQLSVGFWRFDTVPPPTFSHAMRLHNLRGRGGQFRVWRFLVGAFWRGATAGGAP